jgi:hypothetical protein
MAKLYVFGIGGTGSRVMKSFTMLLASGVECGVDTIVPIIIDRDLSNRDLTRTKLLIEDYIAVNNIAQTNGENRFFKTKIELLNNELCLQLKDNTQKFDEFIGKNTMTKENQALVEMLFSEETLNLDMTAGFQGNPNIGSVVLNQFDDSDVFRAFASDFKDGDKIFIISSIFGGTGASGFPLLRKVLQTPNVKDANGNVLDNWGLVNKAPIGAISVLPYFQVKAATDGSMVDSDTFIDKTKAALTYYKNEDKKIDTLYYIADKRTSTYEHHNGGDGQKNNAHFVEVAAALSILDFVEPEKKATNIHRDNDAKIERTTYKEFGIDNDLANLDFTTLEDGTKQLIINSLSRFLLFRNYMQYVFEKECKYQPYAKKYKINEGFTNKDVIKKLKNVQDSFFTWLQELEQQTRQFSPFNLTTKKAFDFVKGDVNLIVKQNWFDGLRYKDWSVVDNELNLQCSKIKLKEVEKLEQEKQFMEVFYRATSALLNFVS